MGRVVTDPGVASITAAADQIYAAADPHQQQRGNTALGKREVVGAIEKSALRLGVGCDGAVLCSSGAREVVLQFILSGSDQNDVARRPGRLQDVERHVRYRLLKVVERMDAKALRTE